MFQGAEYQACSFFERKHMSPGQAIQDASDLGQQVLMKTEIVMDVLSKVQAKRTLMISIIFICRWKNLCNTVCCQLRNAMEADFSTCELLVARAKYCLAVTAVVSGLLLTEDRKERLTA